MIFYTGFRQNKFKNKRTEFGGRLYASKLESSVAADLELARHAVNDADRVTEVIPQFQVNIWINNKGKIDDEPHIGSIKICQYRPDFKVTYVDGHEEIIEAKGLWLSDALIKWRLLEALYSTKYPEVILRIVK